MECKSNILKDCLIGEKPEILEDSSDLLTQIWNLPIGELS
jgi:hypothetical protein